MQMMSFKKFKDKFEIERLCTKPGISIIGGTKKIFKQFFKQFKPKSIFTYSNNDYFTGNVYKRSGFKLVKITEPNYLYFKNINDILSREQCMKSKLIKMGYSEKESEKEIMVKRNFVRIYNSGNKLFEMELN